MSTNYKRIAMDGFWTNNIVFTQLLALCPLMAVTDTATNGLGMGIATTAVLASSGVTVSIWRHFITHEIRIPALVLIIATLVTLVEMGMNAWMHEMYKVLGLFIPLIVTNCAILGRAEIFASRNWVLPAFVDGLFMGIGFTVALVSLGAIREILGSGTLFANASLLLGPRFSFMEMTLIPDYKGFLLFVLPPGGFIALGFLIAFRRIFDKYLEKIAPGIQAPNQPAASPKAEEAVN